MRNPFVFVVGVVLASVQVLAGCDKTAALEGGPAGTVQVMAYANQAAFPACNETSKGLMSYSMEDSKFYICDGTAYVATSSPAPSSPQANGKPTSPAGMNLCPDQNAPELPTPASNNGMILVNPPSDVDPCSVEGFVIGKEGEVKLKKSRTGELYLDSVPPGDQDVIFKAADGASTPSGLFLAASVKKKGARLNKLDVQPGKIKVIATIEMNPLVSISGKAHLLNKAAGSDDAGITVFIPGTSYTALTGPDGSYEISGVPPGVHNLLFQKEGYARGKIEGIEAADNKVVETVNLILGGTGENGSAVVTNGVQMADGKFHTNTFDLDLAISPADEAVLMMVSEDPSFKGARWKPVSSSYQISLRQESSTDELAKNPFLTMLYGIQSSSSLAPAVIQKTLNIKFANANGLETSIFEVPVEIDLFADNPGTRYEMGFTSAVQIVNEAGVKKAVAQLSNIKIPAFASQMSVRKSCAYGSCTDTWQTPSSSFSFELGNLSYALCGATNLEIRFKDSEDKYVSATTPQITTAEQWAAFSEKMPKVDCGGQLISNTNEAAAPPAVLPANGSYYTNSDPSTRFLNTYTAGKLYVLSEKTVSESSKEFEVHTFTPTALGGSWQKVDAQEAPPVLNSAVLSSTDSALFLSQKDTSVQPNAYKYWTFDIATSAWSLFSDVTPPGDNMSNWNCSDENGWGSLLTIFDQGSIRRFCRLSRDSGSQNNKFLNTALVSLNSAPTDVAGGEQHTCSVVSETGSNAVKCWGGLGYSGALHGDPNDSSNPYMQSKVVSVNNASAVSAGKYHSCAIVYDVGVNKVRCWGYDYGTLGRGSQSGQVYAPDFVTLSGGSALENVEKVLSRANLSCALTSDKKVYCWGNTNEFGTSNLFNGQSDSNHATELNAFSFLANISALSVGTRSICAMLDDGTARCVGGGLSVNDSTATDQGFAGVSAIATGHDFVCALVTDEGVKKVQCKGSVYTPPPEYVAADFGDSEPQQIVAGYDFACALNGAGNVYCWRPNASVFAGNVQNAATGLPTSPTKISGILNATQLHSGAGHACVTESSKLKCFGRNDYWQLGTTPYTVTVQRLSSGDTAWSQNAVIIDSSEPQIPVNGGGCSVAPFSIGSDVFAVAGASIVKFNEEFDALSLVASLPSSPGNSCSGVAVGKNSFSYSYWDQNNSTQKNFVGTISTSGVDVKEVGQFGLQSGFAVVGNHAYSSSLQAVNLTGGSSSSINFSQLYGTSMSGMMSSGYTNPYFSVVIPEFGIYTFGAMKTEYSPTGYTYSFVPETRLFKFLEQVQ